MSGKKSTLNYANNTLDLRHLKIDELSRVLFKGPGNATEIRIRCECCNHYYPPPWQDQLKFEHSPVQSKDGARWAPAALAFSCPKCSTENMLQFPQTEDTGNISLYGDEAYRDIPNNRFAFIYAFVSMLPQESARFGTAIEEHKRTIRPRDDPSTWKFHCADLRDERWRRKYGVKSTIAEINQTIIELVDRI
jgi:hypothetical protein